MKSGIATYDNPHERSRSKVADIAELAKVRLNSLVVLTTAGGYYMAGPLVADPVAASLTCLGTALVASGSAAVNQIFERDLDRLMERTRQRPVADGRMGLGEAWGLALGMSALGLAMLWFGANALATAIALITSLIYVLVYTPLKVRTSLATIVGAVPGALPPLIGWAAVTGNVTGAAPWSLFVIMFLWQLPHFLAIGWMCREDYARAGMPMLPVVDRDGIVTGRQSTLWAATLIPISLLPFFVGLADAVYAVGALLLGIGQSALALKFARHRSLANARVLFYGSIVYLPLLWALMAIGRR